MGLRAGNRCIRLSLFAAVAAALLIPSSAGATYPGANGRIAFHALGGFPSGPSERGLFDIQPNGRGERQLFSSPDNTDPSYSPDGSSLAYSCGGDICVSGPAGGLGLVVTSDPNFFDSDPVFTPDGRRIIFAGSPTTGPRDGDIYSVRVNGTGLRRVTSGPALDESPTVSPRTGSIVFVRNSDLYSVRPNGSQLLRLTRDGRRFFQEDPDFAPNGRRIIYTQDSAAPRYDTAIRTMRPNGSRKRTLVQKSYVKPSQASWSPNGRRILFIDDIGAGNEIHIAPSSGTEDEILRGVRQVVGEGSTVYSAPAWRPR